MGENRKELLNNKDVVDEINRHRWLESEKAGKDIGFEIAAEDWLKRFSTAWMQYHMPEKLKERSVEKIERQERQERQTNQEKQPARKTRRASSYYQ